MLNTLLMDNFFLNSALQGLYKFSGTKCEVEFLSQETSHDRCSSPYLRKQIVPTYTVACLYGDWKTKLSRATEAIHIFMGTDGAI